MPDSTRGLLPTKQRSHGLFLALATDGRGLGGNQNGRSHVGPRGRMVSAWGLNTLRYHWMVFMLHYHLIHTVYYVHPSSFCYPILDT